MASYKWDFKNVRSGEPIYDTTGTVALVDGGGGGSYSTDTKIHPNGIRQSLHIDSAKIDISSNQELLNVSLEEFTFSIQFYIPNNRDGWWYADVITVMGGGTIHVGHYGEIEYKCYPYRSLPNITLRVDTWHTFKVIYKNNYMEVYLNDKLMWKDKITISRPDFYLHFEAKNYNSTTPLDFYIADLQIYGPNKPPDYYKLYSDSNELIYSKI